MKLPSELKHITSWCEKRPIGRFLVKAIEEDV